MNLRPMQAGARGAGAVLLAFVLSFSPGASAAPECTAPGTTVVNDAAGDQTGAPLANTEFDIERVGVFEPAHYPGDRLIGFTIKVANLQAPPRSGFWRVLFSVGTTEYHLWMFTPEPGNARSAPLFAYGHNDGGFIIDGEADGSSTYAADGTISIVVSNARVGAPGDGAAITAIRAQAGTYAGTLATPLGTSPRDTTAAANNGSYTLGAGGACGVLTDPPPQDPVSCVPNGARNDGMARLSPSLARDLAKLPLDAPYGAIVHFSRGDNAAHRAVLASRGFALGEDFAPYVSAIYATGPVAAFRALAFDPSVSYLEANASLRLLDESHGWATRARVAQEAVAGGPWFAPGGARLTGAGVGVAIVDSGVNAPHPDLADHTARNFKVTCPVPLLSPANVPSCQLNDLGTSASSDTTGGHGTHVAGIALGDGTASTGFADDDPNAPQVPGTFTGVAPDATLYAFGAGEGLSILTLNAAASFHWILRNNPTLQPKIRIVSNSYGGDPGVEHDEGGLLECLATELVQNGVSVAFAASNDGGDGSTDMTNSYCKHPTPGVVCVANYDDLATGRLDGPLNASSSRGPRGTPAKYPDISAPGTNITATCSQAEPGQGVCATGAETRWQPYYGTISGTSMATPHVAGALALLYQAKPAMTPAEAEELIQDTARKVRFNADYIDDPQNPGTSVHFGYGAGLLDVPAALAALGAARGTPPVAGAPFVVFAGDADPIAAGAADVVALEMQEYADGAEPGIAYRIAVRDATQFDTQPLLYRLAQNVDGRHFESSVRIDAAGVSVPAPGPGNTAPGTSVSRTGNVVTLRVPYTRLGYPPLNAPVHNIAVSSFDANGAVDFAPSPAGSFGPEADLTPMYGRAFTVTASVPPPGSNETVCTIPGRTMLVDDPGDQVQAPPGSEAAYDIEAVRIAEPDAGEHADRVVVTFKVAAFPGGSVPSGTRWVLRFNADRAPPAGEDDFFIAMTTESSAAPRFVYGTTGVRPPDAPAGARVFTIAGDLGNGSGFLPDGTITLVVARDNALFGPLAAGGRITKAFPSVRAPATPGNNAIHDQGEEFEYVLRAPNACALANRPPVPALSATPTNGTAPLAVQFDASGSLDPDAGDAIASYRLDFGDGSAPVTQASPSFQHAYAQAGNYVASLLATDTFGLASAAPATVAIQVSAAQGATPPGAPTIGSATPGDRSATIAFSPPADDGGAAITGYTVTCQPGNVGATGAASPIRVGSLTNGTTYTCSVRATNSAGTGPASAGVQVTPSAPVTPPDAMFANGFE